MQTDSFSPQDKRWTFESQWGDMVIFDTSDILLKVLETYAFKRDIM